MDTVAADFSPELRPQLPQLAQALPQPTTSADVLSVEASSDHAIVHIRYSSADRALTLRSRWEDVGGRPAIAEIAAVD